MEDTPPYDNVRYVKNTDGCDIFFNENNEELIPTKLFLTRIEIVELINSLYYIENSPGTHSLVFKKVIEALFSQIK